MKEPATGLPIGDIAKYDPLLTAKRENPAAADAKPTTADTSFASSIGSPIPTPNSTAPCTPLADHSDRTMQNNVNVKAVDLINRRPRASISNLLALKRFAAKQEAFSSFSAFQYSVPTDFQLAAQLARVEHHEFIKSREIAPPAVADSFPMAANYAYQCYPYPVYTSGDAQKSGLLVPISKLPSNKVGRSLKKGKRPARRLGTGDLGSIKLTHRACVHCKASHVGCESARPCRRCIAIGKADSCIDAVCKKQSRKSSAQTASSRMRRKHRQAQMPCLHMDHAIEVNENRFVESAKPLSGKTENVDAATDQNDCTLAKSVQLCTLPPCASQTLGMTTHAKPATTSQSECTFAPFRGALMQSACVYNQGHPPSCLEISLTDSHVTPMLKSIAPSLLHESQSLNLQGLLNPRKLSLDSVLHNTIFESCDTEMCDDQSRLDDLCSTASLYDLKLEHLHASTSLPSLNPILLEHLKPSQDPFEPRKSIQIPHSPLSIELAPTASSPNSLIKVAQEELLHAADISKSNQLVSQNSLCDWKWCSGLMDAHTYQSHNEDVPSFAADTCENSILDALAAVALLSQHPIA